MLKENFMEYSTQIIINIKNEYNNLLNQNSSNNTLHDIRVGIRHISLIIDLLILITNNEEKKSYLKIRKKILKKFFKILSVQRDLEVQLKLSENLMFGKLANYKLDLEIYNKTILNEVLENKAKYINLIKQNNISITCEELIKYLENEDMNKDELKFIIDEYEGELKNNLETSIRKLKKNYNLFHATRITIKKYRYFLELKSKIFELSYEKIIILKRFQDILGETNDLGNMLINLKKYSASNEFFNEVELCKDKKLKKSIFLVLNNYRKII